MRKALALVCGGAAIALALILGLNHLTTTPLPDSAVRVLDAERSLDPALDPHAIDAASWTPIPLPDDAPFVAAAPRQRAWYRLRIPAPATPDRLHSLLFATPYAALKIWINGQLIADAGIARSPVPEYRHALRYTIAPSLWHAGSNEVTILSVAQTRETGLGQVWLGDAAQMARYKSQRNLIEKRWPTTSIQIILVLAVVLLAFFSVRPGDTAFAWFAASLGSWALHASLQQRSTPLPWWPNFTYPLTLIALVWFALFGLMFVRALCQRPQRAWLIAAWSFALLVSALLTAITLAGSGTTPRSGGLILVVPGVLLIGMGIVGTLWQSVNAQPSNRETSALLLLASLLLTIGLRDWMRDLGLIANAGEIAYLPFAVPAVFLVFGGMLLHRHAAALRAVEQANLNLERKVEEKTRDLETNYKRLAEFEGQRARAEERDRLVREMHDGVGGHLVHALALSERLDDAKPLSDAIRDCLDDLRVVMDTANIENERLNDALATFRERIDRRLHALGIALHWDFTRMPELPCVGPQATLHILRMLQELITNVIKHAAAQRLLISIDLCDANGKDEPAALQMHLEDDGCGFSVQEKARGRGLGNVRKRVEEWGGSMQVSTQPGKGTRVQIAFPMPQRQQA
ncbi:MAG: ATP-binding protein [Lysobacteraceae bacterium]